MTYNIKCDKCSKFFVSENLPEDYDFHDACWSSSCHECGITLCSKCHTNHYLECETINKELEIAREQVGAK